jgi:hypothetical protein
MKLHRKIGLLEQKKSFETKKEGISLQLINCYSQTFLAWGLNLNLNTFSFSDELETGLQNVKV